MGKTTSASLTSITDNFEQMVTSVIYMGAGYKPVRTILKVPGLQGLLASGKGVLGQVSVAESATNREIAERAVLFAPLQGRGTKLSNTLYALSPESPMQNSVDADLRKLRGQRASEVPTNPDGTPGNTHSVSEGSYAMQVKYFTDMINNAAQDPLYVPEEEEMTLTELRAYRDALLAANSAVKNAEEALKQARINRDEVLFGEPNGLVPVALQVKAYVKGAFGAKSPQYKLISGLKFIRK
jgi:hypothetical protein